jgi:ABC-type dipeptide/oligopeptide/nickel transport system permease subunit
MANLPQIIFLILIFLNFGLVIAKHGEEQAPYNAGAHLISVIMILSLLYWGGFFDGILR